MDTVDGVESLRAEHGPIFAVIGVFDGLHLGHAYLLEHLVREASGRGARASVITFDHHPDEVLTGSAPPLLLHPDERLERLASTGVEVTVVQHFDEELRQTTYDAFIDAIRRGTKLAGLLMTPDAAFGYERRGTPETLATLGAETGFDVVVVPPFTIEGRPVRSTDIRTAIRSGDLRGAAELLGRPVTLRGEIRDGTLSFDWPLAMPPDGTYPCTIDATVSTLTVEDGHARLADPSIASGLVAVVLQS